MWSIIYKKDVDLQKLNGNELFNEYFEDLILVETKNAYILPRYITKYFPSEYIYTYYGQNQDNLNFIKTNFKFTQTLRQNQIPIVNQIISLYNKQSFVNGIIKANPGIGKTVISIYLASKIGLKTIIVVHSDLLLRQWIKAIKAFTNLTDSDIGLIRQKTIAIDRPICIAMVQSLMRKIKDDFQTIFKLIDNARFGLVFYDEVHSTSASLQFSKTSILFRTRNMIGLSATPFHSNVQEILMKSTIGDLVYECKSYDFKPSYDFVYYYSNIPSKKINRLYYQYKDYVRLKAGYNALLNTESYLETIKKLTQELLNEGHTILILVITISQVELISQYLEKHNIKNRKYYGNERNPLNCGEYKVIIGTKAFCGEGFDFKELSALILGSSLAGKKSLIQVVGRIMRSHKDKKPPIIKDLVDLSFPQLSLNEVKIKKQIISREFDAEMKEIYLDQNIDV